MDFVNNTLLPLLQHNIIDQLRPILTPVARNLPSPINDFLLQLVGTQCHSTLIHNLSITNPDCTSLLISKILGTVIILASTIVKIPQILKILTSQSSAGLSFLSVLLETLAFLITLAYNVRSGWPFSTYGETALILAQDVVIGALILQFSQGKYPANTAPATFVVLIAGAIYALFSPSVVPAAWLQYLQSASLVLSISSKVPQIISNWTNASTGQLSAFAVFNYLFGSLSRIFTTLAEVDDKLILFGFVAGFALNAVIAAQMVVYWKSSGKVVQTEGQGVKKVGTAKHGGEISGKVGDVAMGEKGLGEAVGEATGRKKGGATAPGRRG